MDDEMHCKLHLKDEKERKNERDKTNKERKREVYIYLLASCQVLTVNIKINCKYVQ